MRIILLLILMTTLFCISCSKEKEVIPEPSTTIKPAYWKKYVGNYKVYDTLSNYKYDMSISHSQSVAPEGTRPDDSLTITNFADTFDITFQFNPHYIDLTFRQEYLSIGFNDSIVDYNNKSWFLGTLRDDTSTVEKENSLINDTMIMYFEMDNIKYYIPEAQPYFYCKCKHVAVKQ